MRRRRRATHFANSARFAQAKALALIGVPTKPRRPVKLMLDGCCDKPLIPIVRAPNCFPTEAPAGCSQFNFADGWQRARADMVALLPWTLLGARSWRRPKSSWWTRAESKPRRKWNVKSEHNIWDLDSNQQHASLAHLSNPEATRAEELKS